MRAARFSSRWLRLLAAGSLTMAFPALAAAAEFDGGSLSPFWGVPFAGILLSIALLPLRSGAGEAAFGLLVLASPDAQRFQAGMGLHFLTRIAESASGALSRLQH